jgi:hypothetical protein
MLTRHQMVALTDADNLTEGLGEGSEVVHSPAVRWFTIRESTQFRRFPLRMAFAGRDDSFAPVAKRAEVVNGDMVILIHR